MSKLNAPIQALTYLLVIAHGLNTIAFPSQPVSDVLGAGVVYWYGFSFVGGGAAALVAVLRPNFKLESVALWPLFGGYALYDVALWVLVADQHIPGEPLPAVYGPAFAVAVVSLFFLGKAVSLWVKTQQLVKAAKKYGDR